MTFPILVNLRIKVKNFGNFFFLNFAIYMAIYAFLSGQINVGTNPGHVRQTVFFHV